jgi:hypothetical protein
MGTQGIMLPNMATDTRDTHLHIRLFSDEMAKFKRASKRERKPLSQWIREACNAWAKRIK